MEYFIFNDIDSRDLGLVIKSMPLVPQAIKNIESINVNGRNGNLHIINDYYLSKSYSLECILIDKTKLDLICLVIKDKGILKLSKYPDRYFNVVIKNQISFKNYTNYLQEFPIQFEIHPIAFGNNQIIENITADGNINVGGNVDIYPIIEVTGTGQLTINGYNVVVNESGVIIDCDLMNCTKNNLNANDKVILDEFPKLNPGINHISFASTIANIKITYREGWL